ncbi:MAG: acyl-CoA dehydrogenase family protein [Acidimicrobiales bacterium]
MPFEYSDEELMLFDLVDRFVEEQLMPLENDLLARVSAGEALALLPEDEKRLLDMCKELGLWALDAPEEVGGAALPARVMLPIQERLSRTLVPFLFPPDSPNLHMLMMAGNDDQKKRYMEPYAQGEMRSNIAISEPQAGADPAAMRTRAVRDGDEWVINGRKIWVSGAGSADFIILMAVTDPDLGSRGMTAFIVEKDTPGYIIERSIPMLGGVRTYELVFDDMRIGDAQVLGEVNKGYAPMQHRLTSRRLEMGGTCVALAERALKMMCEHVQDREVFGETLASKQAIQWWIADAEIAIHATRLMVDDAISKVDRGDDIRNEASMIKVYATEMAGEIIDHAMQSFGAMGMTQEFPLYLMAQRIRLARIYEGPTEVHRMVVARRALAKYPTS